MGEVISAVGRKRAPGIETRMTRVEGRVDALEQTLKDNREAAAAENKATHDMISEVLERLGKPKNGDSQPASGLYWAVEAVSERVKPFEKLWERVKGAIFVGGPLLAAIGWLSSDKLLGLFRH